MVVRFTIKYRKRPVNQLQQDNPPATARSSM